jgi:hypothetical protein
MVFGEDCPLIPALDVDKSPWPDDLAHCHGKQDRSAYPGTTASGGCLTGAD